jgi:hypothetical protein
MALAFFPLPLGGSGPILRLGVHEAFGFPHPRRGKTVLEGPEAVQLESLRDPLP